MGNTLTRGREWATRTARRVAPELTEKVAAKRRERRVPKTLQKRVRALEQRAHRQDLRLRELEAELMEQRKLNRRLGELTDVVQEVLMPATDRDEAKLAARLDATSPSL